MSIDTHEPPQLDAAAAWRLVEGAAARVTAVAAALVLLAAINPGNTFAAWVPAAIGMPAIGAAVIGVAASYRVEAAQASPAVLAVTQVVLASAVVGGGIAVGLLARHVPAVAWLDRHGVFVFLLAVICTGSLLALLLEWEAREKGTSLREGWRTFREIRRSSRG